MEDGNRLYLCGTNAHSPKDWVIYVSIYGTLLFREVNKIYLAGAVIRAFKYPCNDAEEYTGRLIFKDYESQMHNRPFLTTPLFFRA